MSAHQDSAEIKLTLETILLNMQEGNAVIDVRSIKATLRHLSTLREQRDELLEALRGLERANDALCAVRSRETYDRMMADCAAGEMHDLDVARGIARAAIARAKS